jgi:hypothetical protein
MPRPVRRHATFMADYVAILAWLEQHGDRDWILVLAKGLDDVVRLLSELPGVGSRMDARESVLMRKIIFPKGPYVAWYAYDPDDPEGEVWLLRLFHARQRRPAPSLRRWVRRGRLGG